MDGLYVRALGQALEGVVVTAVTVLMTVYNTPAGPLRQAIDSIRAQTLRDFEFLMFARWARRWRAPW